MTTYGFYEQARAENIAARAKIEKEEIEKMKEKLSLWKKFKAKIGRMLGRGEDKKKISQLRDSIDKL